MKIIKPLAECIDDINPKEILRKLERCGRVSHQSEPKGNPEQFIRMLIKRGHESVLEHVSLTFHIVCDRAIQNELVRHRHASFTVESTRYVGYKELTLVNPLPLSIFEEIEENYLEFLNAYGAKDYSDYDYKNDNHTPEIARAVLPLCLKSELYMTANLREWRHILKLRTSKYAHPQMRVIANQIFDVLKEKLPVIVEDINHE